MSDPRRQRVVRSAQAVQLMEAEALIEAQVRAWQGMMMRGQGRDMSIEFAAVMMRTCQWYEEHTRRH